MSVRAARKVSPERRRASSQAGAGVAQRVTSPERKISGQERRVAAAAATGVPDILHSTAVKPVPGGGGGSRGVPAAAAGGKGVGSSSGAAQSGANPAASEPYKKTGRSTSEVEKVF